MVFHARRSRIPAILAMLMLVAFPALAAAHAFPESSSPAPGANLQTAPTEVTITFDDEIDPASSHFKVKDEGGANVGSGKADLTVADRNVLRGDVTITEPGLYSVLWTALSIDGDTTTGSFTFGFQATGPVPSDAPQQENPDTAMPPAPAAPLPFTVLGGTALLLAAVLLATRRTSSRVAS
jgi:methionine-rich copper-binding protein CopC